MNLPIKLVDLVTLLFLSLLVVIIIFIILQRNIKRFKLRNVKDPHFITCKSIPKPLKDSIIRKHQKSHEYVDPPLLFTRTYQSQAPEEAKSMVIRMKAFDTGKCLENALGECNFRRPASVKFEEYIEDLIEYDDKVLPKDLLRTFRKSYISALFDPQPFTLEMLRELNRTINRIIEHLANEMEPNRMFIMRHLLELDANGDFDLKKYIESSAFLKHRQPLSNAANTSSQYQQQLPGRAVGSKKFGKSVTSETIVESTAGQSSSKKNSKLSKDFFHKKTGSSDLNKENSSISMSVLGQNGSTSGQSSSGGGGGGAAVTKRREKTPNSRKYEEIKDTSFDSVVGAKATSGSAKAGAASSSAAAKLSGDHVHTERSSLLTSDPDDNDQTLRWSAANESIKNYDSENEEIPLVSVKKPTHHKKKSSHGTITASSALANIISSTTSGSGSGSGPFSTSNVEYSGALNQGFNETNI